MNRPPGWGARSAWQRIRWWEGAVSAWRYLPVLVTVVAGFFLITAAPLASVHPFPGATGSLEEPLAVAVCTVVGTVIWFRGTGGVVDDAWAGWKFMAWCAYPIAAVAAHLSLWLP